MGYFSGSKDNNFKHGRVWYYLKKSYKNIGIEWSFRPFDIFNFYIAFNGGERDYTFSFWFIWVFYIKFSDIFKRYPREWNSMTNNRQGGFLDSATRKIGISQYYWNLSIYIWHDGEGSWYKEPDQKDWQSKKDFKIYHKFISLETLILGSHKYTTIDEEIKEFYLDLPEDTYKLEVSYNSWVKKYERFLFRFLNKKGKHYFVENSGILYLNKNYKNVEKELSRKWITIKIDKTDDDFLKEYRKWVIDQRGGENWIPEKYKLQFERKRKLEKLNNQIEL